MPTSKVAGVGAIMHRVIAVTPAGRRGYLELLAHYVIQDDTITEWHLWDNCRQQSDRDYIHTLAETCEKIKIVRLPQVDGTNNSINRFYKFCNEPDTFYIKMDDDLVYLPPGLGARLRQNAAGDRGQYLWWSPLVINNAICSWLLKYTSAVTMPAEITAQAACRVGWRSPDFAESLHRAFIRALKAQSSQVFEIPSQTVSLSRFSINCIGFFGADVLAAGDDFCPMGVDDEEWISAVLPAKLGRSGRIVGDLTVAHYSYYTQESALLKTDILDEYYGIAGLKLTHRPTKKLPLKMAVKFALLNKLLGPEIPTAITTQTSPTDEAGGLMRMSRSTSNHVAVG